MKKQIKNIDLHDLVDQPQEMNAVIIVAVKTDGTIEFEIVKSRWTIPHNEIAPNKEIGLEVMEVLISGAFPKEVHQLETRDLENEFRQTKTEAAFTK